MEEEFCPVCSAQHDGAGECPGELRATGPERHGWAVAADAARGVEIYGVVYAPSAERWRARIVTYPHAPWTIPGSSCALKFLGSTPEEAEAKALEFILKRCNDRRRNPRDGFGPWDRRGGAGPGRPPPRLRKSLPVRYGHEGILVLGTTANLSTGGMFVTAQSPLPEETPLDLEMEIFGCIAALRGTVMWRRERLEPGRPRGMGVRLLDPPAVYRLFVHGLK
jgi:hypothetical protein